MSLFSKVGLAMIPSAYKTSKVYSVLPNDADGDFDFARNSTATRVNKDGLIESVGVNVPRLNYPIVDGVVRDIPHLLLEPSRLNYINSSTNYFSGSWTGARISEGSNITAPDSSDSAHKLVPTDVTNTHYRSFDISSASAGSYTASAFFKKDEYTVGAISVYADTFTNRYGVAINLEDGTFISDTTVGTPTGNSYKIENYINGWYRLSVTISHTSGDLSFNLSISPSSFSWSNGLPRYLGDNSSGAYSWGAQLEAGSYPTSYFPTSGGTQAQRTRAAETCNGAGTSEDFNSSEGVLFVEAALLNELVNDARISISDGSSVENRITFSYLDDNEVYVQTGYTSGFAETVTLTSTEYYNKIALVYDSLNASLFVNGFEVATNTMSALSGLSQLQFGRFATTSNPFYGKAKQVIAFKEALTDAELENLTSWDSFTELATELDYKIHS